MSVGGRVCVWREECVSVEGRVCEGSVCVCEGEMCGYVVVDITIG